MAALCKRVRQCLLAKDYMCVSVSVSEWRGSGPPSGNSDKGFSKRERKTIPITVEETERETYTEQRQKETE